MESVSEENLRFGLDQPPACPRTRGEKRNGRDGGEDARPNDGNTQDESRVRRVQREVFGARPEHAQGRTAIAETPGGGHAQHEEDKEFCDRLSCRGFAPQKNRKVGTKPSRAMTMKMGRALLPKNITGPE